MTTNVEYEKLQSTKKDELLAKMRSGEIVVPQDKELRNEFLEFASSAPDSEVRKNILSKQQNKNQPSETKPDGSPDTKEVPASAQPDASAGSNVPWWKNEGYSTEKEAIDAHATLRKIANDQKAVIDRLNGERGPLGRKVQELQEKVKSFETAAPANIPVVPEPPKNRPTRPKPPVPTDFEDGFADDGYLTALAKYNSEALPAYEAELDSFYAQRDANLRGEFQKIVPKVEEAATFAQEARAQEQNRQVSTAWDSLWNVDIPTFQKKKGLNTSVPVKQMSEVYAASTDPNITPYQRQQAIELIKTFPKADVDAYSKIREAVESAYDFSTGVPIPKTVTKVAKLVDDEPTFIAAGDVAPTKEEELAYRSQHIKNEQETVGAYPGSKLGSGDIKTGPEETVADLMKKFTPLLRRYAESQKVGKGAAFEATPDFKEYVRLRNLIPGMRKIASKT